MDEMKNAPETASATDTTASSSPAEKTKRVYTPLETAFAWFCFLAGYLFFRILPLEESRLGGFLFVLALFAGTAVFLHCKGTKIALLPAVIGSAACVLSASLILCANKEVCALAYTFTILTYLYFLGAACGSGYAHGISGMLAADYLNAALLLPFASLGSIFRAAFSGKAAKSGGKIALRILAGAFLALVPTTAVAVLLSYDDGFTDLMHRIFSADVSILTVFSHLNSVLFGIFAGMYIFGLYTSASDKSCTYTLTESGLRTAAHSLRCLDGVTVLCATVPLLFLYVVFFISQWQYYVSAFTGVLPENLSYAQYAREGFFNLCAVSFINLCVMTAALLLSRRKAEKSPVFLKAITVLYCVFTLVLIATAISKMVLYINTYGLTQMRVYSSVFMIALAVLFALILVKQFLSRTPAAAAAILCVFLLFSVLALGNADAYIARYNVDRYLNGTLDEADIDTLAELGDAGVPQLVRLAKIESEKLGTDVKTLLERHIGTSMHRRLATVLKTEAARFETEAQQDRGVMAQFFAFNIPAYKAQQSLIDAGLIE